MSLILNPKGMLVCMSGGQDSTTVLAWAVRNWSPIEAVNFDYGQQHEREKHSCKIICGMAGVKLHTLSIQALREIGGGGLTSDDMGVMEAHPQFPGLPASFVPLRNLILLSTAAALAVKRGFGNLAAGVCQTDYSGYPDCREVFIHSLTGTIMKGLGFTKPNHFDIWTPLMKLDKAESVKLMDEMGCLDWLAFTHTCYNNAFPPCGRCPACVIRERGFTNAGIPDPLVERSAHVSNK